MDQYHDNTDISPKVAKINTITRYRSTKLHERNPADSASYIVVTSAITVDRNVTEPLLTGNDTRVYENHPANLGNKTALSTSNVAAAVGGGTPTNVNVAGVGPYKQKSGNNDEFRGVNAGSELVTTVLNPGTNEVEIDVVEANFNKDNMLGGVFYRLNDMIDIVNDATETEIFNVLIPGGKLGTNRSLRLTIYGDYLCNSGTARFITLKIKYGATTLYNDTTNTILTDAQRRAVRLVFELVNMNVTNSQQFGGVFMLSDAGGATSGIGDIADDESGANSCIGGSASENSALDKSLIVTITNSAAEANVSFRRQYAILEVL